MATSYSIIYEKFDDLMTKKEETNVDLYDKGKYLRNAIPFYMATISQLHPHHELEEIEEDLTEIEINLLALLMNDSYLDEQILTYNRIINISNEFVKMTGAIDRVKTLKEMKLYNQQKINQILSGII